MGAISAGAKAGKESGQKSGKKSGEKAGQKTDPNGNRLAQDGKAAATGAASGAAKGAAGGAAKGAVKGGTEGVKKGAELGAKVGGSIPYAGVVLGPALGAAGAAVGGATGTALGGASGVLSGAASGATSGAKSGIESSEQNRNDNRKKKGGIKDFFKNMAKNAKDAVKGDMKAAFKLKFKAILIGVVVTFVIVAMFVFELTGKAESISSDSMKSVMANSSSDSATLFNETGSLILATDSELEEIADKFFEDLEPKNESYYDAFKIKYSKTPSTVAKKIKNVINNDETVEVKSDITASSSSGGSGATNISENRTIYEHILRTEKYNFNNITWRSFVKDSNGGVKSASMSFQVDSDTKLKYPSSDSKDTSNSEHTLTFFTTMVRPYLQSWYIPFDLAVGTGSSGSGSEGNINTKFAAEIIASAYHEIVLDRYKIETLNRKTNYLVYDKITTTTTTTRTCGKYKIKTGSEIKRKKGEECTKDEYEQGLCKDAVMSYTKNCSRVDRLDGNYGCSDTVGKYTLSCSDVWKYGCSYGVLKKDIEEDTEITTTLCVDAVGKPTKETEKDIRESKSVSKDKDNITYRWDYVTSTVKTFDNATSTDYAFEAYNNYSTDNYYNFINKKNSISTVDKFKESEEKNSKADEYTHNEKDYNEKKTETNDSNKNWNKSNVVSSIPKGATLVGNTTTKTILETKEIVKKGKEYNDEYSWSDKLNYKESKSGTYSVESVKDVISNDLSSDEEAYYQDLVKMNKLNLVDIMNADSNIYKKYLSNYTSDRYSENVGYRRGYLNISYTQLSQGLKQLAEDYPISGLAYGSTLGVKTGGYANLDGINFEAGGDVGAAIVAFASKCNGMTLAQVRQLDKYGATFNNHWCAMFASLSIRVAEEATGTKVNIPNFAGCTTFRSQCLANNQPWFFDVIGSSGPITNDTNHLASLNIVQPGDILLIRWAGATSARSHADIVKTVERDASGNVTKVVTIDGNFHGTGSNSWSNSVVDGYTFQGAGLKQICSIMSIAIAIQ